VTFNFASGRDWLSVLSPAVRLVAVVGLVAAGLSLAGCGRKAGLDAPPGASLTEPSEVQPTADTSAKQAADNLLTPPGTGKAPVAARGENKRILLDGLLN
jgi:predicted small lipoprotein YifL